MTGASHERKMNEGRKSPFETSNERYCLSLRRQILEY